MYYAEKGNGSYLNGKRIHVGTATTMGESLISIGTSPYYKEETEENFQMFSKIFKECQGLSAKQEEKCLPIMEKNWKWNSMVI